VQDTARGLEPDRVDGPEGVAVVARITRETFTVASTILAPQSVVEGFESALDSLMGSILGNLAEARAHAA